MRRTIRMFGDRPVPFTVRDDRDEYTLVEVWDERYYEWGLPDVIGQGVLDIGANIGAFTVWAGVCRAARVRAVEAEPGNYRMLAANVADNFLPSEPVETIHAAAAPYPVKVHTAHIASGSWTDAGDGGTPIEHRTLDQLMDGLGDDVLVKIDIEGGEYDLLDAASDKTIDRIARLVMEYHAPEEGSHRHLTWTPDRFDRMTARLITTHRLRTNGGDPHKGGLLWADRR